MLMPPVDECTHVTVQLCPAQAAGVDPAAPRRQWPREVLRRVVSSLARGAPRQLLARELSVGAAGPAAWWARQQAHARCTAATSMVRACVVAHPAVYPRAYYLCGKSGRMSPFVGCAQRAKHCRAVLLTLLYHLIRRHMQCHPTGCGVS